MAPKEEKPIPITVPLVSSGPHDWIVVEWVRQPGDDVVAHELVARLEEEKVVVDVFAPASGKIMDWAVVLGVDVVRDGDVLGAIEPA